jgi:MFS family permease
LLNPPVRWLMLTAPFAAGVSAYGFYAAQPYLLQLYGNNDSYAVSGLAAGLVAGAQIVGGASASVVARVFRRRTSVLLITAGLTAVVLAIMGLVSNFWVALALLAAWGVMFAATTPVRQAFLNGLIPSAQRATVLSSDNLLGSGGGVVIQPALGRAADAWSYGPSYVVSAGIQLLVLPFIVLARRERAASDERPGAELRTQDEQIPVSA